MSRISLLFCVVLALLGTCCTKSCTSCVAAGTLIATPSGPVPVESLRLGDFVLSFDVVRELPYPARITAIRSAQRQCLRMESESGATIRFTPEHPFFSPETRRYERGAAWLTGDLNEILICRGSGDVVRERVIQCVEEPGEEAVFDLTVDSPDRNFIAGGFVVHNKSFPGPRVDPAVTRYSGLWQVHSTLVVEAESGCPDLQLDSAVLDLDLVLATVLDAECIQAADDRHVGRYDVTSPDFDTASASEPGRSRLGAQACSNGPGTEVSFTIGGLYSLPAEDITVVLSPAGTAVTTETSFGAPLTYTVYSGEPIVSVDANVPGEDDDCDGEIDEEDEHVFEDEIDPEAIPVCTGTLLLEGIRSGLASAETLMPLLDTRRFPPMPIVLRPSREE